jgi:hypothetical protein
MLNAGKPHYTQRRPFMHRKLMTLNGTMLTFSLLFFLMILIGCGNGEDLAAQISGKWQLEKDARTIEINLNGEPKSLIVDGRTHSAVVEKIDKDAYVVQVKVETETGNTEVWSFRQIWNDNGSTFKLAFRHGDTTETLVSAGRS